MTAAVIQPGKRLGAVDVRFADKPPEAVRAALKAAGFRWSRYCAAWYGPACRLPLELLDVSATSAETLEAARADLRRLAADNDDQRAAGWTPGDSGRYYGPSS